MIKIEFFRRAVYIRANCIFMIRNETTLYYYCFAKYGLYFIQHGVFSFLCVV